MENSPPITAGYFLAPPVIESEIGENGEYMSLASTDDSEYHDLDRYIVYWLSPHLTQTHYQGGGIHQI